LHFGQEARLPSAVVVVLSHLTSFLIMARRQAAAKTSIAGDSSTLAAELKQEGLSTVNSAIQAAEKEGTENGRREDGVGAAPKKSEQDPFPPGDSTMGKQESKVSKPSQEVTMGKCVNLILSSSVS
jgi:hypothetical protein